MIVIIFFTLLLLNGSLGDAESNRFYDEDLQSALVANQVEEITLQEYAGATGSGVAIITMKGAEGEPKVVKEYHVSDVAQFRRELTSFDVKVYTKALKSETSIWSFLFPIVTMVIVLFIFIFIMQQAQGGGGGSKVMSFGKSKAKMTVIEDQKITFKNVAGLQEEKEELKEVVDFLKKPRKFVDLGARIPKGVLLVGPPGTGKTLLAKAVAGEAGKPFFSISGSDFVEMFVGVGASRVRDLFEQAKKNSPCIVFIDEIDAVGRKRGAGLGGGHDEREQTLNQLLVEMDGFGINEGVIVIAATNRVDILDPALLRPGRFDRSVYVGRPDIKGREEILEVHAKGKPLSDDVDLEDVAKTTYGFTGADLENLLNEAAIYAARGGQRFITMENINKAFIKVAVGTEKKSRKQNEKERKITAYHEAGHAIMFKVLSELDPVHSISIIPTGRAGGYTMPLPQSDPSYQSKLWMEQEITSLLGGRAAEELILKDVTTGASNDIQRATKIARAMVTKFGMSKEVGLIHFGDENEEVFIGRDFGHVRNYGEAVAATIDAEIKRLIETSYEEAKQILGENMEILHKTAELLLAQEKVTGEEFDDLFDGKSVESILTENEKRKQEEKERKAKLKQEEKERKERELAEKRAREDEIRKEIAKQEEADSNKLKPKE